MEYQNHTSRWEFSKSKSSWHFDPQKKDDNNIFRILGRFHMDFSEMIDLALNYNEANTFGNRIGHEKTPYTTQLDNNDLGKLGLPVDHPLFNVCRKRHLPTKKWPEKIGTLITYFGLEHLIACVHVQYPGQVFPLHIDDLTGLRKNQPSHLIDEDPYSAVRFVIPLQDWQWGHIWGYGNTFWNQWQAGEVAYHHWRDVPHYTANAGHSPRLSLQLTGIATQKTHNILARQEPFSESL